MTHHLVPTILPGGHPPLDIAISGSTEILVASQTGLFVPDETRDGWRDLLANALPDTDLVPTAVTVTASGRIITGVIGGVVVSDDRGASWRAIPFRTPAPTISALVPLPDQSILLAATLEDGVFLSEDNGDHWTAWNFGLFDRCVLDLSLSRNVVVDHSVLALTGSGCFLSRNTGKTWHDVSIPSGASEFTATYATGTGWLVASAEGVVYSVDSTGTFDPIPVATLNTEIVAFLPRDETSIIAVTVSGAVISIDTRGLSSHLSSGTSRDDAFVTCATLLPGSIVLGWSGGGVTSLDL